MSKHYVLINIVCSVLLSVSNANVDSGGELLNSFNYTSCNEVPSCSLCAIIDECIFCGNECQYIDEECLNGDGIEETPGCTDYESVSIAGFDTNEQLTYEFSIDFCETIQDKQEENSTICVEQTRDIVFWVKASNISIMTFDLFAKLSNMIIDGEEVISHHDTENWPLCSVNIKYGVVKQLICPNISRISNETFIEYDNSDKEVDLNEIVSNSILIALRELLPRFDSMLYAQSNIENHPNGKVIEKRRIDYHANNNTNRLHEIYQIDDFVEWQPDVIPSKFTHSHGSEIDENNKHITRAKGSEDIEIEIGDKMFHENINYELSLTQIDVLKDEIMNGMKQIFEYEFTNDPNHFYVMTFTLKEWRKALFKKQNKAEFDWHYFDNHGNEYKPQPNGTYFDLTPNRRRNLLDSKYIIYENNEDLVNTHLLGIPVNVNYFAEVSFGIPFVNNPNKARINSEIADECSSLGKYAAKASNYYDEISECCNVHDWDYVNCDMSKTVADNRLVNCANQYDTGVGELIRAGMEIPISFLYYMRSKMEYCNVDFTSNPLNAEFQLTVKIASTTIFRSSYGYSDSNKDEVGSKDLFKVNLAGGCVFVYIGFLCFELWASIELNFVAKYSAGPPMYIGFKPYAGIGVTADAYATILGIARVGLLLRGDILQVALPIKLTVGYNYYNPIELNKYDTIELTADLELTPLVLTASTYYRLRYIDAGCRCSCSWFCCPSCWFRIKWSGYKIFWTQTWYFFETTTYNLITWKPIPSDGDPIYYFEGVDRITLSNRRRSRRLLGSISFMKPHISDIKDTLNVGRFSMKDIRVDAINTLNTNEYLLRIEILFYEQKTAVEVNNRFKSDEYRNQIKQKLQSDNNRQLVISLEESKVEERVIIPTVKPTQAPTFSPTVTPTQPPTTVPTFSPSSAPTNSPTYCYNNMKYWNVDIISESTQFKIYSECQTNTFIKISMESLTEFNSNGLKTNNKITSFSANNVESNWTVHSKDNTIIYKGLEAVENTFNAIIDDQSEFQFKTLLFYDKNGGYIHLFDNITEIIEENTIKWIVTINDWTWLNIDNSLKLCVDVMSNNNYKNNKQQNPNMNAYTTFNLNDFVYDIATDKALCITQQNTQIIDVIMEIIPKSNNGIGVCAQYSYCDGIIKHDANTIYTP
eukprot:344902_1